MKKNGKYRFSLQFPEDTVETRKAGELLERLGNRKSALVVAAVGEYLLHHPELEKEECKIEVYLTPSAQPEALEQMVGRLVEEKMQELGTSAGTGTYDTLEQEESMSGATIPESMENDVGLMLENLDLFG